MFINVIFTVSTILMVWGCFMLWWFYKKKSDSVLHSSEMRLFFFTFTHSTVFSKDLQVIDR